MLYGHMINLLALPYIDDKAIRFDNNWKDIAGHIQNYTNKIVEG